MEIIKRTRTIEEVVGYKSKDGKEFATKEECEKWEKSAKGVLMDMYKSLEHLGRISEQDLLYLGGCDDYFYDIVKPNSVADIEIENLKITDWNIEQFGYKPITTFFTDFSIADNFGESAVIDTYNRAFEYWKSDCKYLTELVMVLNWKIWEHYENREPLARIYDGLWREASNYAVQNLKGEELRYYYRTTD